MNDSDFKIRLGQLHEDIVGQGRRVLEQATKAVDAYFDHDPELAREAASMEAEVDRIDVEIERLKRRHFELRAQSVTEKIEDTSQFAKIKKDIARLLTEQNARRRAAASLRRLGS